ncbi:MAG: PaaI family thioesterase [Dehalococcoidia bacterium]
MVFPRDLPGINNRIKGTLPGTLGVEIVELRDKALSARMSLRPDHLAPNGFLHAASVVGLADTACGLGSLTNLPEGGTGFTTIELKTNFLATARDGVLTCEARLVHGGRTTQVWDAEVRHKESDKTIAVFRCTQLILYMGEFDVSAQG